MFVSAMIRVRYYLEQTGKRLGAFTPSSMIYAMVLSL